MLKRWIWKWLGIGKLEMHVVKDVVDLQAVLAKHRLKLDQTEKRLEVCERELDVIEPEESGRGRRRRLWLQELEKQELTAEEKKAWESGM